MEDNNLETLKRIYVDLDSSYEDKYTYKKIILNLKEKKSKWNM